MHLIFLPFCLLIVFALIFCCWTIGSLHSLPYFRYLLMSQLRRLNQSVSFLWYLGRSRYSRFLTCPFYYRMLQFLMSSYLLGRFCWWPLPAWSCHYVQESCSCWVSPVSLWAPCFTWCETN
jgi:hypothetical protein